MGSIGLGLQVQHSCAKVVAGSCFCRRRGVCSSSGSAVVATARAVVGATAARADQLRSSLGGGSSIVPSRSLFMRTALLGLLTPAGMFSTLQPAHARSRVSIQEVRSSVLFSSILSLDLFPFLFRFSLSLKSSMSFLK